VARILERTARADVYLFCRSAVKKIALGCQENPSTRRPYEPTSGKFFRLD